MNELNLNATIVKEVRYDHQGLGHTNVLNFTVQNCAVNAYIEKIVFYLDSAAPNFALQTQLTILDRGHTYPGSINGFIPTTYASIGTTATVVFGGTNTQSVLVQASSQIVEAYVNQATQDSEGIGNIYVKLTRSTGVYNVGFTMAVFYKPLITHNSKLNTRNQISNDAPFRVVSQVGLNSYADGTSYMIDQTNNIAKSVNPRNNVENVSFGFIVNALNPYFYFGTPYPTRRWFLGFSSDCTPNVGVVTFSYFNGSNFVGFLSTNVYNGALGPGTNFANDGVVIFNPDPTISWNAVVMPFDPYTVYNRNILGLGTLASNNLVNNPGMHWIRCQVGFATSQQAGVNTALVVSTVVPLIDPDLPLTYRRRLIPS